MTNTALGAGAEKAQEIILSVKHMRNSTTRN